jgi:hypothetical protein
MVSRIGCALALLAGLSGNARADDPYPFAGVFSFLDAALERHYGMDKFICLASFSIQRGDGSYTAYHIAEPSVAQDKPTFHPYEIGTCSYDAAKHMETCRVSRSDWGEYSYFVEHVGEADGVIRVNQVSLKNPGQMNSLAVRKCPFTEEQITPFLSEDFLNYSDDNFGWVMLRWLPFNPDLGPKIARALGIAAP